MANQHKQVVLTKARPVRDKTCVSKPVTHFCKSFSRVLFVKKLPEPDFKNDYFPARPNNLTPSELLAGECGVLKAD